MLRARRTYVHLSAGILCVNYEEKVSKENLFVLRYDETLDQVNCTSSILGTLTNLK